MSVDEQNAVDGFPATLDLSTADTRGNLMENGWKDAIVFEVTPVLTENPNGNLPVGTPGINVAFKIDGGSYDNRRVWNYYWMPTADGGYDAEKRMKLLGMLARFLIAIGYSDESVKSPSFTLDFADMQGRECSINTKYDEEYDNNKVSGVKARKEGTSSAGAGLL
jgi:hypothetical protein